MTHISGSYFGMGVALRRFSNGRTFHSWLKSETQVYIIYANSDNLMARGVKSINQHNADDITGNPGATERLEMDTIRVFGVLEVHLSGKYSGESRDYLAGKGRGKYSIADIGTWAWVKEIGVTSLKGKSDEYPYLLKYIERIAQRPACQRGIGKDYGMDIHGKF